MRPSPLLAALAAALALAPAAVAHVSVQPDRVDAGSAPVLTFALPNELESDVVELRIEAPGGVTFAQVAAEPGWRVSSDADTVTWRGRLAPGRLATFAVHASLGADGGAVTFQGRASGTPTARSSAGSPRSRSAATAGTAATRTLGKSALFVAIAALAVAVGAGFFALYLWLRPGEAQ